METAAGVNGFKLLIIPLSAGAPAVGGVANYRLPITICTMTRRTALWILLLIIIAGIGIRSWHVTARSLWFDEAFSWRLIQFPLAEMIDRDQADVHPPLYYILLKGWSVVFGSSLASLRGFSIAAGGATIALVYLFTAYAFRNRPTGLYAAALIALSGFQIQYAWEARMYTLGTALTALSAWLLLHAIRAKNHGAITWWTGFTLANAALAYVHYYTLLTIVAEVAFVAGYLLAMTRARIGEILQWRLTWYIVAAFVGIALLWLPWLPTFIQQNAQVQQSFWIPEINWWSIPDTFYRMFIPLVGVPRHEGIGHILVALLPLLLTVFGLGALLLTARSKQTRDAAWLTVGLGIIPFLLSLAASFLGQSVYQDRYFVFAQVFILIAAAALIGRPARRWLQGIFIAAACIGLFAANIHYWRELAIDHKPGAHAAARLVYTHKASDEPVLVSSPFVFFAIDHYAQEEFQAPSLPQLYAATGELIHFAGGPILTTRDIVGNEFFSQSLSSFWLVDTTGFGGTPLPVPAPWQARETQRFAEVYGYQGEVIVTHYQRN